MVGAFTHGGVDVARASDDDQVRKAEIYQPAEAFGAVVGVADDAEPAEEIRRDDLGLCGVLQSVVVVVVAARDLRDDGGIGVRKRRRYVALKVGRDARVFPRTSSSSALWSAPAPTTTKAPMSRTSGSMAAAFRVSRAVLTAHAILSGSAPTATVILSPSLAPTSMTCGPEPNTSTGTFDSSSTGNQLMRLWKPSTSTGSPRR